MQKNIVRTIAAVILLALVFSFVGCDTQAPVTVKELEEGYEVKPQGKITATTYLRSGGDSELVFDKWIKAYNKVYPDVTIKPQIINWADFPVKIAGGDVGDVYYGCEQNVYSYAVTNKAAMSLDAYIDALNIDVQDVFTGLYDLGVANGLLYMVPSDLNPSVFYVNKNVLREEGYECPDLTWTLADFEEICSKVVKEEDDGTYSRVGLQLGTDFPCLLPFMNGFGGQWVDPVNKKVYFRSDEKVLQGLQKLIEYIERGYVSVQGLTGAMGAKFANIGGSVTTSAFTLGTFISRITNKETFDALGLEMDVTCWPEFPTRTIFGGATGFFVYSKTKNSDAAATFALFLLQDDGQKAFNDSIGGGVPVTKRCYNDDFWKMPLDPDEFNYDAFTAYPEAFVGNWPEVYVPTDVAKELYTFSANWLTRHFNNVKDYKDSLEEIETTCNEIWANLFEG